MPYIDKKTIIESLTKDDVIKLVEELGSQGHKEGSNGELIFQSVCHNSDSWKLYYYHEANGNYPARICHCYSGCSESFGLVELVIRAHRARGKIITFYNALMYIANVVGKVSYMLPSAQKTPQITSDWQWINKFMTSYSGIPTLPEYNEHVLERFCYIPHEAFLNDGISAETMGEFEISYYDRDDAIVIPHRDIDGRLIGIRERHLDAWDIANYGKYTPVTINGVCLRHPLGDNLYGIHINQNKIRKMRKALLVEGEKSVMQNHTMFGDDDFSLAVCGSNISQTQIQLLLKTLGVAEVILAFDKEYEDPYSFKAEVYRNKLYKKIVKLVQCCRVCVLWDFEGLLNYKDSPTDQGKETLLKLLDNKIEITMSDIQKAFEARQSEV